MLWPGAALCHSRGPAASKMCFALVATLAFIRSGFSLPEAEEQRAQGWCAPGPGRGWAEKNGRQWGTEGLPSLTLSRSPKQKERLSLMDRKC